MKKHLKNGKNLSMGFGFIEFDSVETATNVCRDLQVFAHLNYSMLLAFEDPNSGCDTFFFFFWGLGDCFGWACS